MGAFEYLKKYQYGQVHLKRDEATGLQAIVAVHDSRLGPAMGGCRFVHYNTDDDALIDALRLARGMTYKSCLAGLAHGGGKSVIIKPKGEFDRKKLFESFGAFLNDLGGLYITAEDSGTAMSDMETIRSVTKYVTGVDPKHGGSGDPSPFTALGTLRGIEACVKFAMKRDSLEGLHVAIQGIGNVGYRLAQLLHEKGAKLTVADIDKSKVEKAQDELGAQKAGLTDIFGVDCDIVAPCALGSALNPETVPMLKCKIVAGAANNQLGSEQMGIDVMKKGILYAPDYAINAGGIINVAQEVIGYDEKISTDKTLAIYDTIYEISERSAKTETPPGVVADQWVEELLAKAS